MILKPLDTKIVTNSKGRRMRVGVVKGEDGEDDDIFYEILREKQHLTLNDIEGIVDDLRSGEMIYYEEDYYTQGVVNPDDRNFSLIHNDTFEWEE